MGSAGRALALTGAGLAAMMMILGGGWQLLVGIAAVAADGDGGYVGTGTGGGVFGTVADDVFGFDLTTWGWIHIVLGAIVLIAGFCVFSGAAWARGLGIALAALSAISQFFWMPHQPWWAVAVIAVNVFAIWALARSGGALREYGTGRDWDAANTQGPVADPRQPDYRRLAPSPAEDPATSWPRP